MKGIMFSDELIPMLLDGTKTMTRRIMKVQPKCDLPGAYLDQYANSGEWWWWLQDGRLCNGHGTHKPRYNVGETVYVKEAWRVEQRFDNRKQSEFPDSCVVDYKGGSLQLLGKWRNKIFMPEWASRIKLKITDVRAEHLQDISEDDAKAEGVKSTAVVNEQGDDYTGLYASEHFANLINKINGPGTWDENPWVWVYEFKVVE